MPPYKDPEHMRLYQKVYHQRRKRSHKTVKISLRNEDYKHFEKLADQRKVTVATLLKQLSHSKLHDMAELTPELRAKLDEMVLLIRSVSNNANQTAHACNLRVCEGFDPSPQEGIELLGNIHRSLIRLEDQLREKLV